MTQQERLKKLFEENAIPYIDDNGNPEPCFNDEIFIQVASELLEERWIRVEDGLPDLASVILCANKDGQSVCFFGNYPKDLTPKFYKHDLDYYYEFENPTHWQPLSQPPNNIKD